MTKFQHERLIELARNIRIHVLKVARTQRVHIGPSFSVADILAVLYGSIMTFRPDQPGWRDRDRLILSKGHGALALYGALAEIGFFDKRELETYGKPGSRLAGHPSSEIPGVEVSTGSLGHGLSLGAGMALFARHQKMRHKVYVILGDGELNEGSVWEAVMFASHYGLANLVAVVDKNGYQQEGPTHRVMNTEPLADKWKAFGWNVLAVNGHDIAELHDALMQAAEYRKSPSVVIAETVKGKGVSFMENDPDWHMKQLDDSAFESAANEILGLK